MNKISDMSLLTFDTLDRAIGTWSEKLRRVVRHLMVQRYFVPLTAAKMTAYCRGNLITNKSTFLFSILGTSLLLDRPTYTRFQSDLAVKCTQ